MKNKYLKIICIAILVFVIFTGQENVLNFIPALAVGSATKTKTVMVYMTGSDLTLPAMADILEMTEASVRDGDNVVLYLGGAKEWPIDLPADKNSIALWHDNDFAVVAQSDQLNMGDPTTLQQFIKYAVSQYPADEYSLILWNHGGGPIFGCCNDVIYEDVLSVSEISAALSSAGFGKNKKLEILGFDACLMGSVETAWALRDYASYMVFSQETEPGIGWNYAFLNSLSKYDDGASIGREIVDSYFAAGEEFKKADPSNDFEMTMSCIDLSKIDAVETSVDKLFSVVDTDVTGGLYPRIARCRRQAKAFGKATTEVDYGLVDLGHLVSMLSQYYPEETKAVTTALSNAVVYNKSNIENSNGLSIFYPNDNSEISSKSVQLYEKQNFAGNYTKFLQDVLKAYENGSNEEWADFDQNSVETVTENNKKEFTLKLTDDQRKTFDHANFYIMKKYDTVDYEEYIPIIDGECNMPDENGVLSEEMPEKMFFFSCYDEHMEWQSSRYPVWAHLISRNEKEQMYYVPSSLNVMDYSVNEYGTNEYMETVHWLMKVTDGVPTMLNAVRTQDVVQNMAQKQLVDYSQFTHVSFVHFGRKPVRDENGKLKPYSEWEWGSAASNGGDLSYGFSMENKEVPDPENYVCMFEIVDTSGHVYATEPVQYEN